MPRISEELGKVKCFIGVDPGQSGGLAYQIVGATVTPMPDSYKDTYDWLYWLSVNDCFAVVERVHSMPGQGVSSMFKFGKGFGALLMALTAAKIPYEEIDPRKWQKELGIIPRKKTESKSQFKNRLKAFAQKLFPRVDGITLKTADALLISEFCRRYREGKL